MMDSFSEKTLSAVIAGTRLQELNAYFHMLSLKIAITESQPPFIQSDIFCDSLLLC